MHHTDLLLVGIFNGCVETAFPIHVAIRPADGVRRMAGGFWRQDWYSNIPVGISPADSRFCPFVFVAGASRVARAAPVHVTEQQRAKFTTDGVRSILGCGPMEVLLELRIALVGDPPPLTTPPKPLPKPLSKPLPPLCTHPLPYQGAHQRAHHRSH
jgi:hypothetical protein